MMMPFGMVGGIQETKMAVELSTVEVRLEGAPGTVASEITHTHGVLILTEILTLYHNSL